MLFDEPDTHQTPPPPPPTITPQGTTHLDHTVMLTPSTISIQRVICGAQLRRLLTQRAGRDTSLNQLSSDPVTLTKDSHMDFQPSWLKRHHWHPTDYSDRPRTRLKRKLRPISDSLQDHLGPTQQIDSFQDHRV